MRYRKLTELAVNGKFNKFDYVLLGDVAMLCPVGKNNDIHFQSGISISLT